MNYIIALLKNALLVGCLLLFSFVLNGCSKEFDGREERLSSDQTYNAEDPIPNVIPSMPRTHIAGHIRGLALLIEFQEDGNLRQKFKSSQADYNELFNGDKVNTAQYKNLSSVKRYFDDQSAGKVMLTHEVTPILKLPYPRSHYTRVTQYVTDAIAVLKQEYPDFLTSRKDLFTKISTADRIVGKEYSAIQALSIIIGGNTTSQQLYSAHASNFIDLSKPNSSVDAILELGDGLYAFRYQMTPEVSTIIQGTFSEIATMSMLCHELGHSIANVRDYYGVSTGGLGYHCLMSFNLYPTRPGPLNPYLKWLLGWAELKPLPSAPADLVIKPNENNTYYVYVNPKNRLELYILENRAKISGSWSESNYSEGLGIWHIDGTKVGNFGKQSWYPTQDDHYEISFIQANIASKPQRALTWYEGIGLVNKGDDDDCFGSLPDGSLSEFSHKTNPAANWWSGLPSGMILSNIRFDPNTKNVTLHYDNSSTGAPSNKTIVITEIPQSVKEGSNPFEIVIATTNIADGEILKIIPPSAGWKSDVTAIVQNDRAVFKMESPALDLSRTSTVEINQWNILTNDLSLFECKTPHNFTMEENHPPLEITITPLKTELQYNESVTLEVTIKNMINNKGESSYRMVRNTIIYLNTTTQHIEKDGVLNFTGQWTDAGVAAGTVIDKVTFEYGENVTIDGITYKRTRVNIPLTRPITYVK